MLPFLFLFMASYFDSLRCCSGLIAAMAARCSSQSTTKPPVLRTIVLTSTSCGSARARAAHIPGIADFLLRGDESAIALLNVFAWHLRS